MVGSSARFCLHGLPGKVMGGKGFFFIVSKESRQSWMAGIEISEMMVGRAWGLYPIMRKNGDWLVME